MKKILIKNAVAIVATNTKLNAVDSLKLREGSFDISNNSMIIADNKIEKIGKNLICEDADEERARKDNESGAMLYGMEYWHLVEDVEFWLSHMSAQGKPVITSKILKAFDELLVSKNLGNSVPSGDNRYQLHSKILSCLRSREEGLE